MDKPQLVIGAIEAMLPRILREGIALARLTRIPRISIGGTRGSYQFISTTHFERFYGHLQGEGNSRGSPLLAFGQPEEVAAYCDRLLEAMGTDGGFIPGSGCEVPANAQWENVKAMVDTGKKRR